MKGKRLKSHIYYKERNGYRLLNSRKNIIFTDVKDALYCLDRESFCGVATHHLKPKMVDVEDIGKEWFNFNICKSCLRSYLTKRYKPNLFLKYKNTQSAIDRIKLLAERSMDLKYIY